MGVVKINTSRKQESHDDLRLENINSTMNYMQNLLSTLETKINVLPRVDENGNSECHFAEDLYAQKEEAVEKVRNYLNRLRRSIQLLEEELSGLHRNLSLIRKDGYSIHVQGAKDRYKNGMEALEKHINNNREKKNKILTLIYKAEEMLNMAETKRWPLGNPKERGQFTTSSSIPIKKMDHTMSGRGSSNSGLSLDNEVQNLFSLGSEGDQHRA